jgi:cytoskeletal protein CcmA (bactofilin family)
MASNDKKILDKVETYISADIVIEGSISTSTGSIRIDGKLNGDFVNAKGLIIGEQAKINANIEAEIVIVAGEVHGNIIASKKLEILEKSKIFGDIFSPNISILEGSIFEGKCKMIDLDNKNS